MNFGALSLTSKMHFVVDFSWMLADHSRTRKQEGFIHPDNHCKLDRVEGSVSNQIYSGRSLP